MIKTVPTLAPNEKFRLEQCEKAIERGLSTFVEVGRALTEIRDSKLYRVGFKTFDAYCKDRWEIDRTRAYQLIGQANVVTAIAEAGVNLSNAFDISKREADAIKNDLPAVSAEIKARVDKGEAPEVATKSVIKETVEKAKAEKVAHQAQNTASREASRAALSPAVQAHIEAKDAAIAARKAQPVNIDALQAELDELREANAALETENASLKAELKRFEEMRVQFEKGGFEEVIRGKDEQIRVLKGQVVTESRDKDSWRRSAEHWKAEAIKLGWTDREVIDLNV